MGKQKVVKKARKAKSLVFSSSLRVLRRATASLSSGLPTQVQLDHLQKRGCHHLLDEEEEEEVEEEEEIRLM
jgi:hypothetical protein